MSDNNGNFIVINRKIVDWGWYKNANVSRLFLHLLLKANWKQGVFEGNDIERGQLVTSLKTLRIELGLSMQNIKTALKKLKSTKEITEKATNKYRIVTICNYESYQNQEIETNKQLTIKQQSTNNQLTTIEQGNKETKKQKNIYIPEKFSFEDLSKQGKREHSINYYLSQDHKIHKWLLKPESSFDQIFYLKPITSKECDKLLKLYNPNDVKTAFTSAENYAQLLKGSTQVYSTVRYRLRKFPQIHPNEVD